MEKFSTLIVEKLLDKYENTIGEQYKGLKSGILELIDDTIESEELVDAQNFMNDYIQNPESGKLNDFVENNEIFNFYLKYQADIDEICNNKNYFDNTMKQRNIFSLYDVLMDGTKFAVKECMSILYNEIFQKK